MLITEGPLVYTVLSAPISSFISFTFNNYTATTDVDYIVGLQRTWTKQAYVWARPIKAKVMHHHEVRRTKSQSSFNMQHTGVTDRQTDGRTDRREKLY